MGGSQNSSNQLLKAIAVVLTIFVILNFLYSKYKQDKNAAMCSKSALYTLFDSTFSIRSPFPISKDTVIPNPNALAFNKVLYSSYFSDNISLNLAMYQYKIHDTIYRGMAEAYLRDGDKTSFLDSKILKQDTLTINGKQFLELTETETQKIKENIKILYPKISLFLICDSKPNLYLIYFEDNLHSPEADSVKNKLLNSITIKNN